MKLIFSSSELINTLSSFFAASLLLSETNVKVIIRECSRYLNQGSDVARILR